MHGSRLVSPPVGIGEKVCLLELAGETRFPRAAAASPEIQSLPPAKSASVLNVQQLSPFADIGLVCSLSARGPALLGLAGKHGDLVGHGGIARDN